MYNYDHDCPFEAYVTNLGKYNEGELMGEWVKFPTTHEEMQKVFERIGIGSENEFGNVYEEWFITDYNCYVDGLHAVLGEYESLDELNYLAASIEAMDKSDFERFETAIQVSDYSKSVKDLINLTENLDKYDIYPNVHDHDDLGRMYIEEYGAMEVPDHLKNYIDYEAYGRDIALDEISEFTDRGYVRDTGDSFYEHYDGDRENIPEEYRVMSAPEDAELSEDEKLEMAQDLAFDLDEFFRQKDPQYASAHSDAHAGKELIADLLMEGKTAAIKDRLTEMAQLPDDELFSRIGSYEQVTGYEAHLDTDVPAIREKLEQAQEVVPLVPDDFKTGEKIQTPRGSFSLTDMTKEQMEAAGYGFHHSSDDGMFHIMGNGTRAFAIISEDARTYDIYQLKDTPDRRDYAFEPLDRLHEQGRTVDMQNYDKVYSSVMRPSENLESIYTKFNIDRPEDFTGHSLSMSDVVVIHQQGQDTAHYCDRFGFAEVPEFLKPENYLKNTEMAMEDDLGMIDGIINNGKKEITPPGADEKPSIRERLAEAKRECSERKPPVVKKPDKGEPGHDL
ncbi:MAG: antirestriction protein ArdA [Lachnospiraceae bacterium]